MVGTLEQGIADVARRRNVTDKLDDYDKAILGGSMRLDLPWTDPVAMRRIGELLCGLGERFKQYSVRGDLTEFAILSACRAEAVRCRRLILEAAKVRQIGTRLVPLGDTYPIDKQ